MITFLGRFDISLSFSALTLQIPKLFIFTLECLCLNGKKIGKFFKVICSIPHSYSATEYLGRLNYPNGSAVLLR